MKKALFPPFNSSSSNDVKNLKKNSNKETLKKILLENFGHTSFRGLQLEAIEAVLAGKDCFCLMPTGGGKSLCYQIPALARVGIVLVVSPLIALMENQVSELKARGVPAEYICSTQKRTTKDKIYEDINSGKPSLRLIYVTPELIDTSGFLSRLNKLHSRGLLNLIAIDEAHCISSWGHDFRPSYRKLSILRKSFPDIPILALTATAASKVKEDVINSLNLHQPLVLQMSFNRPNIYYEVRYKDLLEDMYMDLLALLKSAKQECAIIYCLSRNCCDEIGANLINDGVSCCVYHAGLSDKKRSSALDDWASGKIPVVIATIAFGMGIDRKDVRIVCHFNIPKSVESFYQESGRAGRDQKAARSILYYGLNDRRSMEYLVSQPPQSKARTENSKTTLVKKATADFKKMVQYCEQSGCRRQKILAHFGEKASLSLCNSTCDACKYPNRLSKQLNDLSQMQNGHWNKYNSQIVINRSESAGRNASMESEFWSHATEISDSEEDISCSDDEASLEVSKVVTERKFKNVKIEKKLDVLMHAEEEYNAKHGIGNEKKGTGSKNIVPESFRDASRKRLQKTVQEVLTRFGETSSYDDDLIASSLESQIYKDYGKIGKSFYNSGVASTSRWLSKSSLSDIQNRIGKDKCILSNKSKASSALNATNSSGYSKERLQNFQQVGEKQNLAGHKRPFPEDESSD